MGGQAALIWALIFSSIGLGFFIYGKKQRLGMPMMAGIALMLFPYFVTNSYAIVLVGLGLIALPYFVRF